MALAAGKWGGKQYTVTGTAAKLSTILGSTAGAPDEILFRQIDFKAKPGNTGTVFLGSSGVTTSANIFASLEAAATQAAAYTIGPFSTAQICSDDIYVVGTANDILYIAYLR